MPPCWWSSICRRPSPPAWPSTCRGRADASRAKRPGASRCRRGNDMWRPAARAHVCRKPRMTPNDYDHLRRLLKDRSGLVLSGDKQYLVESRLLPLARKAGFAGLSELVANLHGPHPEALTVEVVEAMTT